MARLVPAIHVFFAAKSQDVDARDKPGMTSWDTWPADHESLILAGQSPLS
jgi:hypothetical protein